MALILSTPTSNLTQAFQMSAYTWVAAVFIGLGTWLLAKYVLKTTIQRLNIYTVAAVVTGVFAAVTSMMWFYYFNVFLSLPFFVLLLFFTFQLLQVDRKSFGTRAAKGLVVVTLLLALLSALFFGVFSW